jgi:NTE family protein
MALALSSVGIPTTLFHVGSLICLNQLAKQRDQKVTYCRIDTQIDKYPADGKLACDLAKTNGLKHVRTRQDAFDLIEQETPINWGYALCDAGIRSFIETAAPAPTKWPCPAHPIG